MADGVITEQQILEKANSGQELSEAEKNLVKEIPAAIPSTLAPIEEKKEEVAETPTGIKKPAEKKEGEKEETAASPKAEEKKPEASPSDKPGDTAAAKDIPADAQKRLDTELAKPEGQEDLVGFTDRERAYFFEMRRSRTRAQEAERALDVLKFKTIQDALKKEEKPAEVIAAVEEVDPFADKEADDILTVEEARKLLADAKTKAKPAAPAKAKEEAPAKEEAAKQPSPEVMMASRAIAITHQLQAERILEKKGVTDFNEVLENGISVLVGDKEAESYIIKVRDNGGNVALASYNLIKASKRWPEVEAKLKVLKPAPTKEAEAKANAERAERIEKNDGKVKTTGAGGGGAETGEYSLEEFLAMSPKEFGSLPARVRKSVMDKYASHPNQV